MATAESDTENPRGAEVCLLSINATVLIYGFSRRQRLILPEMSITH